MKKKNSLIAWDPFWQVSPHVVMSKYFFAWIVSEEDIWLDKWDWSKTHKPTSTGLQRPWRETFRRGTANIGPLKTHLFKMMQQNVLFLFRKNAILFFWFWQDTVNINKAIKNNTCSAKKLFWPYSLLYLGKTSHKKECLNRSTFTQKF